MGFVAAAVLNRLQGYEYKKRRRIWQTRTVSVTWRGRPALAYRGHLALGRFFFLFFATIVEKA
jgi:hypothetical protein